MILAAIVTLLISNVVLGRAQKRWFDLNGAKLHFNLGNKETHVISLSIFYRLLFRSFSVVCICVWDEEN